MLSGLYDALLTRAQEAVDNQEKVMGHACTKGLELFQKAVAAKVNPVIKSRFNRLSEDDQAAFTENKLDKLSVQGKREIEFLQRLKKFPQTLTLSHNFDGIFIGSVETGLKMDLDRGSPHLPKLNLKRIAFDTLNPLAEELGYSFDLRSHFKV